MYMKFRKKAVKIETADELREWMIQYIEFINELNKPRFVVYDKSSGNEYPSREAAEKDGVHVSNIVSEFEEVPIFDLKTPTLSGFAAYIGISESTYTKMANKNDDFKEADEWFRTILLSDVENLLLNPANKNSGGAFRVAVNRHGWTDKSEVTQAGSQEVQIVYDIVGTDED